MRHIIYNIFLLAVAASVLLPSCSTTRVLQDDQYRLEKNKIVVTNDKNFNVNDIEPYIKQSPNPYFIFGWNPFLNIYNWSSGKGNGWDRFVQKIGVAPVVYEADLVESSIENISNHLKYRGYYNSDVRSRIEVRKKRVKVTYEITLGKRFPIKEVRFSVPEGELADEFWKDTSSITVRKGDWLSEAALDSETDRASKYFRDKGFYGFSKNYYSFEADTLSVPDSALLTMSIREYTRNETEEDAKPFRKFSIGNVAISYPQDLKIREKVLTNLNTVIPGSTYSESTVNTAYSRLASLNMFNTVNIELNQVDTNVVDCDISLSKSRLQGFKLNLEASTNSSGLLGVSPQLSYFHKNIFHGGEWLNLSFMGNFQFRPNDETRSTEFGVSAGLSFPKFLFLPYRLFKGAVPRTEVNVSYNYQNRPEYTRNIISTALGYTGNIRGRLFYQFYPLQLNIVRLFNLDPDFYNGIKNDPFMRNSYQDHFDLGSGATFQYTTNTDANPKTTYFYSRLQIDIAGNMLSLFRPLMDRDANGSGIIWNTPYSQYVKAEFSLGRTWVFGRNDGQAVATRFLAGAGYAYGNSDALPFEKHFYAGGANSLRGWQARSVGPGLSQMDRTFIIPNQTGDMKLEANIEYRFKMFWKIAGAAFIDAGNVWTIRETGSADNIPITRLTWKNFGESIAMNWGVGIRLDLNFLLLRFDMGMRIHDPARTDNRWVGPSQWLRNGNYAVHFGVGYPF